MIVIQALAHLVQDNRKLYYSGNQIVLDKDDQTTNNQSYETTHYLEF